MSEPIVRLENVHTHYGLLHVLKDVSLEVRAGEIVCLLGGNACGKSTTLRAVLGVTRLSEGAVYLDGERVDTLPTVQRVARGIAIVPENRRLFGALSVEENLLLGAHRRRDKRGIEMDLAGVYGRFPRLAERRRQPAGTLSGGEQQLVAVGRSLMARPRLLLMDEPSMGLAPRLVTESFALIRQLNAEGIAVLMVEQNARAALRLAHRAYVLQTGRVVLSGSAVDLLDSPELRRAYLGRAA
jgi:branched-chain amino acid transport system ATP-binding protein